jgi:hypothetical protein
LEFLEISLRVLSQSAIETMKTLGTMYKNLFVCRIWHITVVRIVPNWAHGFLKKSNGHKKIEKIFFFYGILIFNISSQSRRKSLVSILHFSIFD